MALPSLAYCDQLFPRDDYPQTFNALRKGLPGSPRHHTLLAQIENSKIRKAGPPPLSTITERRIERPLAEAHVVAGKILDTSEFETVPMTCRA